jgi:hypothetical protein
MKMFRLRPAVAVGIAAVWLVLSIGLAGQSRAQMTGAVLEWSPGWDECAGPPACSSVMADSQLDFEQSKLIWVQPGSQDKLMIHYMLHGATPNRMYQVGIHLLNFACVPTFGQIAQPPVHVCGPATRQGATEEIEPFELGVVATDAQGNGMLTVDIEQIASGTYELVFDVRVGVGCLQGGFQNCDVIFQAPGPFGNFATVTVP